MASFDQLLERAIAGCKLLSADDARQFVTEGYVVVRSAFSRAMAADIADQAWQDLESQFGVRRGDPSSWAERDPSELGIRAYLRTSPTGRTYRLQDDAPRAWQAQLDVLRPERLPFEGNRLTWDTGVISSLGYDPEPQPASSRRPAWHKDGWHFRHFLGSPEQALLTVPLYTDILPESGGTQIARDSLKPVAQLLAAHPEGIHADSVQGGGYVIPGLIEQCKDFVELTGEAGDMVLLHPFMLHRPCPNPSTRPRLIANVAVVSSLPMQFDRADGAYSLTELTVLNALGVERLDYRPARPMAACLPFPFRRTGQREYERAMLEEEMVRFAHAGLLTPDWAETCGYASNRRFALRD